jgi:hypothetical protein
MLKPDGRFSVVSGGESEIGCIMRRWYRKLVGVSADVLHPSQSVRQAITLIYRTALTWQTLPFVDVHRMWIGLHGVDPKIELPYQSLLHPIGALHQQGCIWVSSSTEPKHL